VCHFRFDPLKQGIELFVDDAIADKMLRTDNIPKHLHTYAFLKPIIGKTSIVTVSGDYWKKIRKMFNPAFATSHLETLVPGIIEEVMVFVDILESAAKGGSVLELGSLLPVDPRTSLFEC